ncbi:MAG: TetR/AcrR family transcriptional regulator [Alphaproteobacteria bacterium]|nr:TetR/AcrR family transcriptional regulator [Alphaproteobacteria bacterium]
MTNIKNDVYSVLVTSGRHLVIEKGAEFLTARKLSEASGCSVGTIYNQFINMDNYIIVQNMLTLDNLQAHLQEIKLTENAYNNINQYLTKFVEFVNENGNLWSLFYEFHLKKRTECLPDEYMRKIVKLSKLFFADFSQICGGIKLREQKLLKKVLSFALFSMSPFLTSDNLQEQNVAQKNTSCQILLNTYLAGVQALSGEM